MKILITGDREWTDRIAIRSFLSKINNKVIIIHGNARGVDTITDILAKQFQFIVISYPAEWMYYGKSAGAIRNNKMLDQEKPDAVIYFHNNLENSRGTKHCIEQAKKRNIPVYNGLSDILPMEYYNE